MHYLYKITNQVNQKIYIGQTKNLKNRWKAHKAYAKNTDKPAQYIHHAMAKYGIENFTFEVIDVGLNQHQADCLELNYIKQYDSQNPIMGYNIRAGGHTAAHSEETKKKQSEATIKQIVEKGHPAQGRIVTQEERALHSKARLENPLEYTPELRQKMSDAHIGYKATEEAKNNLSKSLVLRWEKRHAELVESGELKCNAPDCDVNGPNIAYLIVDDIRYCSKHGQRLNKHGTLETKPAFIMSDEMRKLGVEKARIANTGKVAHNRIIFTEEQIAAIMSDPRSNEAIAKDLGYGKNAIQKLRRSINLSKSS